MVIYYDLISTIRILKIAKNNEIKSYEVKKAKITIKRRVDYTNMPSTMTPLLFTNLNYFIPAIMLRVLTYAEILVTP